MRSEQNILKPLGLLYRVLKYILLPRTTIWSKREDPWLDRGGICERNLLLWGVEIRTSLNFWPAGYWLVTLITIKIDILQRVDKINLTFTICYFYWLVNTFQTDLIQRDDWVGEPRPFTHLCWLDLMALWGCNSAGLLIKSCGARLLLRKHFHISFFNVVIGSISTSLIMKFLIHLHAVLRRLTFRLLLIVTFVTRLWYGASLLSPPLV